jgi:hypothetical protein
MANVDPKQQAIEGMMTQIIGELKDHIREQLNLGCYRRARSYLDDLIELTSPTPKVPSQLKPVKAYVAPGSQSKDIRVQLLAEFVSGNNALGPIYNDKRRCGGRSVKVASRLNKNSARNLQIDLDNLLFGIEHKVVVSERTRFDHTTYTVRVHFPKLED